MLAGEEAVGLDKDFDIQCRQVWLEAWVRTAQSDSCIKLSTPTTYADECLARFKERFLADGTQAER